MIYLHGSSLSWPVMFKYFHFFLFTMKKFKVFITRNIPGPAIHLLKKYFTVKLYPKDNIIPRQQLLAGIKWCDALLCLLTDKIDQEAIDINPNLKVISNYAVGYNNIDVAYATKKGIPVCNTPSDIISDAVAEHTFAFIMALAKRLHEDEEYVREHKWKSWAPKLLLGTMVKDKTLGIIGLGRIGAGVVQRAACLGMKVVYHDVYRNKDFEHKFKAQYLPLKSILKTADFVSLHVPLLPSTRHLIGKNELRLMKPTAYLINTSRGGVVDENALILALQHKWIRGAGLDVYETEPNVNPHLTALHTVVLTPHTASATMEARLQMSKDAGENIVAILKGKKTAKIVNPEIYSK